MLFVQAQIQQGARSFNCRYPGLWSERGDTWALQEKKMTSQGEEWVILFLLFLFKTVFISHCINQHYMKDIVFIFSRCLKQIQVFAEENYVQ